MARIVATSVFRGPLVFAPKPSGTDTARPAACSQRRHSSIPIRNYIECGSRLLDAHLVETSDATPLAVGPLRREGAFDRKRRMVSYTQGFGVSPCLLELLSVEL